MKKNVGITDRGIRFLIAFAVVLLYFADYLSGTLAFTLFGILALTALLNFCPVYSLFRINSLKKKKPQKNMEDGGTV